MNSFSLAELCGLTDSHIDTRYHLHTEVVSSFVGLQKKALDAGLELHIASGFRDFFRQRAIWNTKFNGERTVLDSHSRPIDINHLSQIELIHAIMRWSALPAASRHHWGCDCDIYCKNLLPANTQLQLEPWEYEKGGHQFPLTQWLNENMQDFGFYLPYREDLGGVAREPWHISYRPLAEQGEKQLSLQTLKTLLKDIRAYLPPHNQTQEIDILGLETIIHNLDHLYSRYIMNTSKE